MDSLLFYRYSDKTLQKAMQACNADLDTSLEFISMFEQKMAKYQGVDYAISCCNGTLAMMEAMWACGVGTGSEIIVPALTYWASAFQAFSLGADVKYVDIDKDTLCISPQKIEEKITKKTKAIVVVHLYGHPCQMDQIMDIARKHKVYVIEDFSHAHGALFQNRLCGSIGDIAIASCMREKALPLPEGGIICTNNKVLYERCCAFGHYRYLGYYENSQKVVPGKVTDENLLKFIGAPIGAVKNRINAVSAAVGSEILDTFKEHIAEVEMANNFFMDILESDKAFCGHRCKGKGMSMGGWYSPKVFTEPAFAYAIAAEITKNGVPCYVGHKYFLLPKHIINEYGNSFGNAEQLFCSNLKYEMLEEKIEAEYPIVVATNRYIISAPRFLIYKKAEIERYAKIYLDALHTVK